MNGKKLKEIAGKYYELAKVVMLPTVGKSDLLIDRNNKLIHYTDTEWRNAQYLYIIIDDEIKEGDWYIHNQQPTGLRVMKCWKHLPFDAKKIIATTDKSLNKKIKVACKSCKASGYSIAPNKCNTCGGTGIKIETEYLPEPSPEFIETYIKVYNEGNPIVNVLVEIIADGKFVTYTRHDLCHSTEKFEPNGKYLLKLSKSNEITIRKVKDNYTREEVVELCKDAFESGSSATDSTGAIADMAWYKWLEENL